jgi:hypothetical protein
MVTVLYNMRCTLLTTFMRADRQGSYIPGLALLCIHLHICCTRALLAACPGDNHGIIRWRAGRQLWQAGPMLEGTGGMPADPADHLTLS